MIVCFQDSGNGILLRLNDLSDAIGRFFDFSPTLMNNSLFFIKFKKKLLSTNGKTLLN